MTMITLPIGIYNPSCWQPEPARPSFNSPRSHSIGNLRSTIHDISNKPRRYPSTLWCSHRMPHRALAPQRANAAHRPVLLSSAASSALPPINQRLLPSSTTPVFRFACSANGSIVPHTRASWRVFARRTTSPPGRLQILRNLGRSVFLERLCRGWRGACRIYETRWVMWVCWLKAGTITIYSKCTSESDWGERKCFGNLELWLVSAENHVLIFLTRLSRGSWWVRAEAEYDPARVYVYVSIAVWHSDYWFEQADVYYVI